MLAYCLRFTLRHTSDHKQTLLKTNYYSTNLFSSYLLTTDSPAADLTPFPEFPNGEVGAQREAKCLHFAAISHPKGFLIEAPPSGELEMTFKADPCEMTTKLVLQTLDTHQIVQNHVMCSQDSSGKISLIARFPEPGL